MFFSFISLKVMISFRIFVFQYRSSGKSRVVAVPPSSSPWSRCPFSPFHDPTPSGGEINGLLEICAVFLLLLSHPFAARNVSVLWTSFPFRAIV